MTGREITNVDAGDFEYIRRLLREQSGVELEAGKEYLLRTRLLPIASRAGCASVQELIARLRFREPHELHREVVEALATGETQFFRNSHPFQVLKASVLPELINKRAPQRRLNIWCAAASRGQEPYSVAMLLEEHFPALADWNVYFIASDLSEAALAAARRGCYSQIEVGRGLPAPLLAKYFQKQGEYWWIAEQLARRIEFRNINLIRAWPALPRMDLVLMRNVMIYFNAETKKAILQQLRQLLRPDGYLFLGSAETLLSLDHAFRTVRFGKTVCYQRVA